MNNITINKEKCLNCHACISVCPVKFCNQVVENHVEIDNSKCISCGECIKVCHEKGHDARGYNDDFDKLNSIIKNKTIAIVAPAVVASFPTNYLRINGWLRSIGVKKIFDVGFGAELTAKSYIEHIKQNNPKSIITQPCPAIVNYIEMYKPDLIKNLAPIHSPMMHTILYAKKKFPELYDANVIVISPCIAKRDEFEKYDKNIYNFTFKTLEEYFRKNSLSKYDKEPYDNIDPEIASMFSTPSGLLKTVERYIPDISENSRKIDGIHDIYEYLDKFDKNAPLLIDCLNCSLGCNGGTGTNCQDVNRDVLEDRIKERVKNNKEINTNVSKFNKLIEREWNNTGGLATYSKVKYKNRLVVIDKPSQMQLNEIYKSMYKTLPEDIKNCQSCGYGLCEDMAKAIYNGLNKVENCHWYLTNKIENEKQVIEQEKEKSVFVAEKALNAIGKNLEYINSSASLAEELTRESSNLKESNELVVKKIENIVDKLNDSNESVMAISKSLGVLSNEVLQLENIKDTIKKISENTKMLSLNASIEASRVGDIGKGFAVVGSEIGKLAQRTNEEIEKIKPIIAKIQGGTRVNDDLIKVIVEQNNKILDDSKEIYANSEEVTATLNEILQEVEDIAKSNSIALDDANREQKKILEMLE